MIKSAGAAHFDFLQEQLTQQGRLPEDVRSADWVNWVPLTLDGRALVLGGRGGSWLGALAGRCSRIDVVQNPSEIHHPEGSLDLVAMHPFYWNANPLLSFESIASSSWNLLKEGGAAYFGVPNRFDGRRFLSRPVAAGMAGHSLVHYRRLLEDQGFRVAHVLIPLPNYDGTPLFLLPWESREAQAFFFESIFPLFESVSPEAKKNFAWEYRLAKVGVRLGRIFGLLGMVKFFVSGYGIVAVKES